MRRLLRTHTLRLVGRLALLYVVLMLCRAAFWCYNAEAIGPVAAAEWPALLRGALQFDTVSVLYANALYIVLALVPLHLRESRAWQRMLYVYYVAVNGLLVVCTNLADAVYFRYTQKRFTADEIFFAENDNSLQLVVKFAAENWPLVLFGAAMIALLAWGYRRRAPIEAVKNPWGYYGGGALVLALAAGLSVAGMRGGMTRMTRPITLSNATLYTPDNAKANLILSNPFCILRTMGSGGGVKYERYFAPEELDAVYSPVHRPATQNGPTPPPSASAAAQADGATTVPDPVYGPRPGVTLRGNSLPDLQGRNVVVFVMESMSAEHSALLSPALYADEEVKGYTPFLDSLMREGFLFRRMYANGKRSIQALPAVLGSIPSFKTPFVLMPQSLGESRQLPRMLRDRGYATAFFCGSERGSMGFGAYARSAGVERLFSREDYEARHGRDDFDGYWGIWDEPFLQFMGEELGGGSLPEPFFAALFTLSSHHPFVVPDRLRDSLPEGRTRNHRCVAYTDRAFRRFFERFGGEEWFRRTVFVFVADHVSSEKFAEATQYAPESYHIIGMIYTPDGALRGEYAPPAAQIDLMPTLLGLMGQREPYFAFGRDVLREVGEPLVVNYDNGFEAITEQWVVLFDEHRVTGVYALDDYRRTHNLLGEVDVAPFERRIKAFIQQYYTRIEQKNYTVQ